MTSVPTIENNVVCEIVVGGRALIFKGGWEGDIGPEAWALNRARKVGVLAPEVLAVDMTKNVFPNAFLIMEEVAGHPLSDSPRAGADVHRAVGEHIRLLHQIELEGYGWFDRQTFFETGEVRGIRPDWRRELGALANWGLPYLLEQSIVSDQFVQLVFELLEERGRPLERPSSLLHGDFSARHVYVDGARQDITALIDFGDALSGDPLWDLACYSLRQDQEFGWLLEGYGADAAESSLPLYRMLRALGIMRWEHEHGLAIDHLWPVVKASFERLN